MPQSSKISRSAYKASLEFLDSTPANLPPSSELHDYSVHHRSLTPSARDQWTPPPPNCLKINTDAS